ncbi:hypothetical protein [Acetivibrio mesophilus]|uniref:Uncharacterized protein n=1 Tax=Acetivibrio mesophilus TaxID=2487273 RepID=A0A4Q0I5X2_9FIRM|nr:hypothetical protein [Acetivibrio mesophilus]ODM25259.1 hypothetical protein A7W90_02945 [Clostridium sp. Bc-iso-3]RXE59721.1 hypothetical protein EFD62_05225 [Acetivibrio mesophilus]HHV28557.1 hypothetical protein [Clostridium sp.]
MSNNKSVYERELLYATDNENELGIVHLEVMGTNKLGRVQAVIESKSKHSALDYIDSIVDIIQKDVFKRLDIDVAKKVDIYVKLDEEDRKDHDMRNYVKVVFSDEGEKQFENVDDISI